MRLHPSHVIGLVAIVALVAALASYAHEQEQERQEQERQYIAEQEAREWRESTRDSCELFQGYPVDVQEYVK